MNIQTAQKLLNDPEYISAYVVWKQRSRHISDDVFTQAMDWTEAAFTVKAHQS